MKITGVLVNYLVEISLEIYANYIVMEKEREFYMWKYCELHTECFLQHYCGTRNYERIWNQLVSYSTPMTHVWQIE